MTNRTITNTDESVEACRQRVEALLPDELLAFLEWNAALNWDGNLYGNIKLPNHARICIEAFVGDETHDARIIGAGIWSMYKRARPDGKVEVDYYPPFKHDWIYFDDDELPEWPTILSTAKAYYDGVMNGRAQ